MKSFWGRHRGLRILSYVVLALLFLFCAVPYLIPLGQPQAETSPAHLVGEHGHFLDINGASIYVEEQNPESGQAAIVFVHGFGGSTFSWRLNAPFFADQGYRVVSLDMKGFGLSHKDSASDYSHEAQAGTLADMLDSLEIDQAYLVGHSMGTSVVLHFAHLYPERVLGLISVAGAVNMHGGATFLSALLQFAPFTRIGEVLLTRYATEQRVGEILASAYYQDILTADILDGYYNRLVGGQWAQSLLAMTRDMSDNSIAFALADFRSPTLILWGQNDTWVKRPDIDGWTDQIPSAEFHAIPEAGHMLMEEKPELFNNMVLTFLRSRGD